MQDTEARPANPELRQIVVEASQALALLDAARLEELALSCQELTRTLNPKDARVRGLLAEQARESQADMAVFAHVLAATRANLDVMNRLRELRAGRVEYTERQVHRGLCHGAPPLDGPPMGGSMRGSKSSSQSGESAEERYGNH